MYRGLSSEERALRVAEMLLEGHELDVPVPIQIYCAYADADERAPAERLFELLGEKQHEREAFTIENSPGFVRWLTGWQEIHA